MNRRQFLRNFPKPEPLDGVILRDPDIGDEHFFTFDDLHYTCMEIMDFDTPLKPNYKDDPSYNWNRKAKRNGR